MPIHSYFPACNRVAGIKLRMLLVGFIFPVSVVAEPIPLQEALEHAVSAAQLNKLEDAANDAADARRRSAASFPNPYLFYQRETLDGSGAIDRTRETTAGVSTSLDFLWKRGARIEAAEWRGKIARFEVEDQRRTRTGEVAELYVHYAATSRELNHLHMVLEAMTQVRRVAATSVESGDAPAFELRRVDLAITQLKYEIAELESRLKSLKSRHAALTGLAETSPSNALELKKVSFADAEMAKAAALENRPDLQAAVAIHRWRGAEVISAKRENLPEASLDLGLKEDQSGREGAYVGISVELPIFAESRAPTHIARSEAAQAEVELQQVRRIVAGEAMAAYKQWQHLKAQRDYYSGDLLGETESYLKASTAGFTAGETSRLEQLDALRTAIESGRSEIHFQKALRLAAIKLATATASQIPLQSKTKNLPSQ